MHTRGRPEDMYAHADYDDVVGEVLADLDAAIARAQDSACARDQLIVDPGLGFAKRRRRACAVLAGVERLAELGRPLLVGPSRKSFMTAATGPAGRRRPRLADGGRGDRRRLGGAHIVRVHASRRWSTWSASPTPFDSRRRRRCRQS